MLKKEIGKQLKQIREAHGIKKVDIKLHRTTVYHVENGKSLASLDDYVEDLERITGQKIKATLFEARA
jgi:predicted transcriptional regulator